MSAQKIIVIVGLVLTLSGCFGVSESDFEGVWESDSTETEFFPAHTKRLKLFPDKTLRLTSGKESYPLGGNWAMLEGGRLKIDFILEGTTFPVIGTLENNILTFRQNSDIYFLGKNPFQKGSTEPYGEITIN